MNDENNEEPGRGPLHDIRVIAVEQYAAGPFATQQLRSLGADVIKVEDPHTGGDVGRWVPPDGVDGDSLFFQTFNHGKRSIALDLKSTAGRSIFQDIVAKSDAVVYNLRGDVPARLGLRYSDIARFNPRIVSVSLSAYGQTGPRKAEPGYDYLIQGLSGWMDLTGEPGGAPTKSGLSLVDFASGYAAALAVVSGVHSARISGQGRDWDLSLLDVGISLLTYVATWQLTLGRETEPTRLSAHPTLVPFQDFQTTDGWIVIACAKQVFWERFKTALGMSELEDSDFSTFDGRLKNRERLLGILEPALAAAPTQAWLDLLGEAKVPCGPANNVEAALNEPQVHARELLQQFSHPKFGTVRTVRAATLPDPLPMVTRAAPRLGENTEDVLSGR